MTGAPVAPRLRDLLYGFLFYVIALILFGFGVRVVQGLAAPMHGADPRLVTRVPIPMSVTLAGHGVVMGGVAFRYLWRRYGQRLHDWGVQSNAIPRILLIGISVGMVAKGVFAIANLLVVALTGQQPLTPATVLWLSPGTPVAARVAVIAELCILIPVAEELFFRGFVFGVLRTRYHLIVALLVTNIWFAAVHLDSVVGAFLFGIVLSLVYECTRSLAAPVVGHATYNAIATLVTIFDVPG